MNPASPAQKRNIPSLAALGGGILLILASLSRGLGVNNVVVASNTGDIAAHLGASMIINWALTSVLLLLTGIWLLFLSAELRSRSRRAVWQMLIIGTGFAIFGGLFWWHYPKSLHLALFAVFGLGLIASLLFRRRNKPSDPPVPQQKA